MIRVRYIVHDVDEAVAFYTSHLGFVLEQQFGPAIAMLGRDGLTLLVSGPPSSGARAMPDGQKPEPGGWNRILIDVGIWRRRLRVSGGMGLSSRMRLLRGLGGSRFFAWILLGMSWSFFSPQSRGMGGSS